MKVSLYMEGHAYKKFGVRNYPLSKRKKEPMTPDMDADIRVKIPYWE